MTLMRVKVICRMESGSKKKCEIVVMVVLAVFMQCIYGCYINTMEYW